MDFNKISHDTLIDASKSAFKNSKDFQYEADLLLKQRSYGHSISLAILSIEEFGKSIGYWLLSRSQSKLMGRISFDPDELFRDLQKNHLSKQSIALLFTILSNFSQEEIQTLKRKIDNQGVGIQYDQKIKKFNNIESYSIDFKIFKKWVKEIELIPDLDKLKQSGFYVEIKNSNSVNKPWKALSKEAHKINRLIDRLLTTFYGFLY